MTPSSESTKLWHAPSLGNLELLHAKHKAQFFPIVKAKRFLGVGVKSVGRKPGS